MIKRYWWIVLLAWWSPLLWAATAATGPGHGVRVFLDRNQVSLGDTVTLNIQADDPIGNPDLSSLQKDFAELGTSRSSSVQIGHGKATRTFRLGIALKPLHAGTLTIPALDIGGSTTQPLTVRVAKASSGGRGGVGDPVFMQAGVSPGSPFVGQQAVYTVRLFYHPGVHGRLGDPHADGARLLQLGQDHRYMTRRNGYAYEVVERRWALIPLRGGTISVQGPAFEGRGTGVAGLNPLLNDPNSVFNQPNVLLNGPFPGFGAPVQATAPAVSIHARPPPAGAGKPWLPARDVQLKVSGLPADGQVHAGEPLTLTLEVSAEGVAAEALPEPDLPAIPGARVYPGQTRNTTDASQDWLHATRTRTFAIVPRRNGTLTIPAITLDWWNVDTGMAAQASVPAHTLTISGVAAGILTQAPVPVQDPARNHAAATAPVASDRRDAPANGAGLPWRTLALASFAAWLLVVLVAGSWWLWWRRRRLAAGPGQRVAVDAAGNRVAPIADSVTMRSNPAAADAVAPSVRVLRQHAMDAARAGDAAATEQALLAWARAARPGIHHAGALRAVLADPAQRDALEQLQRARWQGGDGVAACALVAQAFARDFVWKDHGVATDGLADDTLPPLYPPG